LLTTERYTYCDDNAFSFLNWQSMIYFFLICSHSSDDTLSLILYFYPIHLPLSHL
jgi:hypothetical protein